MNRFFICLLILGAYTVTGQSKVQVSSPPKWIKQIDYNNEIRDTLNAGGYYYLLSEWQANGEVKEYFNRTAIKVITEKGLEYASSIQVNFDPSFQKLTFHSITIKRNQRETDVLRDAKFEILRREENMDRLIYDKSLDAILNIKDVQVGDIVEYSYSLKGKNPVFDDKLFYSINLSYSIPIGKSYDRILCKANRRLNFKQFNGAAPPKTTSTNGLTSYEWESENNPAMLKEDDLPTWYSPYSRIEVSEYTDWAQVNKWALGLYRIKNDGVPEVDQKLEQIKRTNPSLREQIDAATRFVQDEIRYLSFSDGIQGFKPHSPSEVIQQKFGDCKDKSFLLSTMLNKLGVESYPALVDTEDGMVLPESLPRPTLFNHCIVNLKLNDTTYWIDPTATLERGSFTSSGAANYHNALVISPQTTSLTSMRNLRSLSRIRVNEAYAFKVVGGSGKLTVKTTYEGDEANSIRNYFKSHSLEEIKKTYTNFYAKDYSEIAMVGYVVFEDDDSTNIVNSIEQYEIENLWQYDSSRRLYQAEFYARIISTYLSLPATKNRSMPLTMTHPVDVAQRIVINLPESWDITENNKKISSPGFDYSSEIDHVGHNVNLYYSYRSKNDYVTAKDAKNHIDKIDKVYDDLSFQLTYQTNNKTAQTASNFNTPYLMIVIGLCPLVLFAMARLYRFNPRSRYYTTAYEQLGGWILLPAIGICLSPIATLVNFSETDYFDYSHWQILVNPAYESYNLSLGILQIIDFSLIFVLLGFSILLIVLLFKRRSSFPILICAYYGLNVFVIAFESGWLVAIDLPTSFATTTQAMKAIRPVIAAVIWVPFFYYSDRVKGTFTQRL